MFQVLKEFISRQAWLDTAGDPLQKSLNSFFESENEQSPVRPLQNFLNGVWLGHPLHPVLTDVPVGAWTATLVLDMLSPLSDDESLETAADITLATGLAAAVASAVTGLTDWKDTYGAERSVGLLHGLTMATGTLLYMQSLVSRRTGSRGVGVLLSTLGYGLIGAGAYIGGDQVYDLGYGVNHTAFDHGPSNFVPVLAEGDLADNNLTKASAGGVSVLLARVGGQVFALDDTCVHAGCSLAGGRLDGYTVTCPCHFSQYDVRDGSVINGPATMPEPSYQVRINGGMIEVKA